jgi:hypothetical protein
MQMEELHAGNQEYKSFTLGDSPKIFISTGCPQGGVLSLLLWSLSVEELFGGLNESSYYAAG